MERHCLCHGGPNKISVKDVVIENWLKMRKWVFTTKPSHFKMDEALVPGATLDVPVFGKFKFEVGDLVFYYASNPVLQMIGKCEIEELGLPFSEVDPRNDLRKFPRHHSSIPWMRLRVLQAAPIPFKPLQRNSLYYYTGFKPSPYPKLLHEGEEEYVMRAFDEAMTYTSDLSRNDCGIEEEALQKVSGREIFKESAELIKGGTIDTLRYDRGEAPLVVTIRNGEARVSMTFSGVRRVRWDFDKAVPQDIDGSMQEDVLTGIRLKREDLFLLATFDGIGLEILADTLRLD